MSKEDDPLGLELILLSASTVLERRIFFLSYFLGTALKDIKEKERCGES